MKVCSVAFLIFVSALLWVGGCSTLVDERRNKAMRERAELENLKADVHRLREQVKGIAAAQEDLYEEVGHIRASNERSSKETANRVSRLERVLKANAVTSRDMEKRIANDLSKKVAEVMRSHGSRGVRVEEGYEHTVSTGETLSEIAAAYGVNIATIVKANNLKNPNSIKEGQKLFIPE